MPHRERHHFDLCIRRIAVIRIQQILVGRAHVDFFKRPIISPPGSYADPARPVTEVWPFHIGLYGHLVGSGSYLAAGGEDRSVFFPERFPLCAAASHEQIVRGGLKDEGLTIEREAAKAL